MKKRSAVFIRAFAVEKRFLWFKWYRYDTGYGEARIGDTIGNRVNKIAVFTTLRRGAMPNIIPENHKNDTPVTIRCRPIGTGRRNRPGGMMMYSAVKLEAVV